MVGPCPLWVRSGHSAIHSITSSARARSAGGTVRPSSLAVSALITSSNVVDCTTGRSAGFAPLRMRRFGPIADSRWRTTGVACRQRARWPGQQARRYVRISRSARHQAPTLTWLCTTQTAMLFAGASLIRDSGEVRKPIRTRMKVAGCAQLGCLVCITSSWPSSSSGTKPLPPHVGHRCSSSVPFPTTPSPLQSGQVFMCASRKGYHSPALKSQALADPLVAEAFAEEFKASRT